MSFTTSADSGNAMVSSIFFVRKVVRQFANGELPAPWHHPSVYKLRKHELRSAPSFARRIVPDAVLYVRTDVARAVEHTPFVVPIPSAKLARRSNVSLWIKAALDVLEFCELFPERAEKVMSKIKAGTHGYCARSLPKTLTELRRQSMPGWLKER